MLYTWFRVKKKLRKTVNGKIGNEGVNEGVENYLKVRKKFVGVGKKNKFFFLPSLYAGGSV